MGIFLPGNLWRDVRTFLEDGVFLGTARVVLDDYGVGVWNHIEARLAMEVLMFRIMEDNICGCASRV